MKTTAFPQPLEPPHMLERIENYWSVRSDTYDDDVAKRLSFAPAAVYRSVIERHLPDDEPAPSILDIGCGPGFFAQLLAERTLSYTGIDCTDAMLDKARANMESLPLDAEFLNMDAQNLAFPDNTFDLVISRYVTWTLEQPEQAYSEWLRVLKPGGFLLNIDANWYGYLFDDEKRDSFEKDRARGRAHDLNDPYYYTDTPEIEAIASRLPLGSFCRPIWDAAILLDLGVKKLDIDRDFWRQAWNAEEKALSASTPAFLIIAGK